MRRHYVTIRKATPGRAWVAYCACNGWSAVCGNPHKIIAAGSQHVGVSRLFDPIVAQLQEASSNDQS